MRQAAAAGLSLALVIFPPGISEPLKLQTEHEEAYIAEMAFYETLAREVAELRNQPAPESTSISGYSIASVAKREIDAIDNYEGYPGEKDDSNITKYVNWYYGDEQTSCPWCGIFVSWCADQCGYLDSKLFGKIAGCDGAFFYLTDYKGFVFAEGRDIQQLGGGGFKAHPGDIFFFYSPGEGYTYCHMGIVTEVGDDYIEITSGNVDSTVVGEIFTDDMDWRNNPYFSLGAIVRVEYPQNDQATYDFLKLKLGLSDAATVALYENILGISQFDPNSFKIEEDGLPSYGILLWHGEEILRLKAYCDSRGLDFHRLDGQLIYLVYSLQQSNPDLLQKLQTQPNTHSGEMTARRLFEDFA